MASESSLNTERDVQVRNELRPGDMGTIIYLHGILYAQEYGFDHTFEPYVAGPMAEFVLARTNRQRLWIVEKGDEIKGSIAIVKHSETDAQLRWLLLHPDVRGTGIGKVLVEKAIHFCRRRHYESVFLWTLDILPAASKIYQSFGFQLTGTKTHRIWGRDLTEEKYELRLK